MIGNEFFMQLALKQAWKYQGLTYPNPAVGAVVVKNNQILSIAAHQFAGGPHAEVYAIKEAFEKLTSKKINVETSAEIHHFLLQNHNKLFHQCSIYTTLEPCNHLGKTPSCANLIQKLGFKNLYVGAKDKTPLAQGGAKKIQNVTYGVMQRECNELLEPFYIWQKKAFVLFKLAQTHNGKITGGYISSKESLQHVHKIREKITKLLIGGNTVKVDRPTLDCRFVSQKAPDVQIYSNQSFDESIPLFNIENRRVEISKDLSFLQEPGFVLVEGGENMLKSLAQKIDWLLTFQSQSMSENEGYSLNLQLKNLHIERNSNDIILWSKVKNG